MAAGRIKIEINQRYRLQDAVQAHRDLGTYARGSTIRYWLLGIARHRCLDALKAWRRWRRRFVTSTPLPERADAAPGADARLEAQRDAVALERALATLPPKTRLVVVLRYQEGMSYEEMAEVLSVPEKTVKSRLFTARQQLKEILATKGITR